MKPDSAIQIVRQLRDNGHEAYLVGGCVRDMVMNIEPSDYDIATSALPEQIMKTFPHTEPIGAQFGVVLVIHRGHPFEVATFRSDEAYVDGRRPTGVTFTDAKTDVLRRDFTINGLLYDPVDDRVIDYVSGQDDIRDKVVRAIGDPFKRFEEDKLRLLRAVRFGARLGYSIEGKTWEAVRKLAPEIRRVSAERIRDEIARILTEGQAARGILLLAQSGLLPNVLPGLTWSDHLERSLAQMPPDAPLDFAFALLLHDVDLDCAGRIVEGIKLSRSEADHVLRLIGAQRKFPALQSMTVSSVKRFLRVPRFSDHLELARICGVAAGQPVEGYRFAEEKSREWSEVLWPQLLLSGQDLIENGWLPGPLFKEILTRVEDEQLEGKLNTREEALNFVKKHYPQ